MTRTSPRSSRTLGGRRSRGGAQPRRPAAVGTGRAADRHRRVAAAQDAATAAAGARLQPTLTRADVVQALQERGVSVEQARERVAALTDAEAAHVAEQIDQAPAGGRRARRHRVHLPGAADHRHPRLHEGLPVHAPSAARDGDGRMLAGSAHGAAGWPRCAALGAPTQRAAAPRRRRPACHRPPSCARCRSSRRHATTAARRHWPRCWCTPGRPPTPERWPTQSSCRRARARCRPRCWPGRAASGRSAGAPARRNWQRCSPSSRPATPVVVLQNLGLSFAPRWHYAVLVGHDLATRELVLRSGDHPRDVMDHALRTHLGAWRALGLRRVPPGRLPRPATEEAPVQGRDRLSSAWRRRPSRCSSTTASSRAGPATSLLASGPGQRALRKRRPGRRRTGLRTQAALQHDSAAAWHNLALTRLRLGQREAALRAADPGGRAGAKRRARVA